MSLEELKQQQLQLVLQRSQLKDQLETTDRLLGQVNFAVQMLESQAETDKE